jgi:urease accessory protein
MDKASITVTTQAAEKVYRAIHESAHITTTLKARDAAKLAWLPQETIVFNRARVCRRTQIEVSSGAELLALEGLVLGRAAHGEKISAGHIVDSWRVTKDGRLVWADSFRATDDVFPHLSRKALLSDCIAFATLLYFGPDLEGRLRFLRDLASSLECQCAATLVSGLMVVRFAAKASCDLRAALRNLLQNFANQLAPGPFRVPKMWSC